MKKLSLLKMMLLLFFVGGATNVMAGTKTGTIAFSNSAVKINAASVTGDDDLGNTWTITTEGTTSFTPNAGYYQVGSGSKPASSITFTTTLPKSQTISAFSAKFGGFGGTAGTISLKVGNNEVGSGELNGTNDVTVSSSESASGTTLTVTVTDIAKGVKCYNISYSYEDENSKGTSIISFPKSSYTATLGETFDAPELTITAGDGDVTYSSDDDDVASVSYDETGAVQVTLNGVGTAVITATIAETDDFASATTSYTLTVNEPVAPYEIQDGLFEFNVDEDFGSGLEPTSDGTHYEPNSSDWTAGNVSMTISGKYRWWYNAKGNTMRLYALGQNDVDVDEGAMEFTVPAGKVITKIEIESNNNNVLEADCGNYSDGTWEGVASRVFLSHIEGGSSVNITKVTVTYEDAPALEVTVGEAGYATLGTTYALDFSNSDIKAYYVSAAADGQLTLTQTNKVAAFEGVLLYKEGGAQEEIPAATEEVTEGDNNDLIAVVKDEENCPSTKESELGTVAFYILNKPEGKEVGFYKANDQKVAAGKAVLMVAEEEAEGAKPFYALGVSAPTGINNAVVEEKVNGVVYNLNGQRVNNSYKGVVIVNGKKVVKK